MKNITPISLDQIGQRAPSALATEPMNGASQKYSFVSTIDAVELVMSRGWKPYDASQSFVRKEERAGFQSHIIKFTMGETLKEAGDERLDLVLFNSHDRGSAFKLMLGIFRLVCSNGLIVGDKAMSFAHKHIGFDQDAFVKSVNEIAANGRMISNKVDVFKEIELTRPEQLTFAKATTELLADKTEDQQAINLADIIKPRRWDDKKDDLWTTYNRAQENVMRGGIRREGKKRTRKVNSVSRDIKLNKALWTLTEEMAKLKAA